MEGLTEGVLEQGPSGCCPPQKRRLLQNLHDTMNREDYEYMACRAEEKAVLDRIRKLRKRRKMYLTQAPQVL